MSMDLSIVITSHGYNANLSSLAREIHSLLDHQKLTHEIIIVCSHFSDQEWEQFIESISNLVYIKSSLITHRNELSSLALCGLHQSEGEYIITLNSDFAYSPNSLLAMHAAIQKSNCQVIYGTHKGTGKAFISKFKDQALRALFYTFSGMPSYLSNYRIIDKKAKDVLKIKTPYFFLFDHLLKAQLRNHAHLDFEGVHPIKFKWRLMDHIIRPIAWTIIPELLIIALLLLNIWILLNGRLLYALLLAILAVLFVLIAYLLKWRRSIAFRVLKKHP